MAIRLQVNVITIGREQNKARQTNTHGHEQKSNQQQKREEEDFNRQKRTAYKKASWQEIVAFKKGS
jgi:hypothetical protein